MKKIKKFPKPFDDLEDGAIYIVIDKQGVLLNLNLVNSMFKNITVTVNPSGTSLTKCTNIKKRKADIRWKKNSYVTGYEIQYCTSKTFKRGVKKKVITKSSTTKYTAAGLASKKTYYVRIRTYKTVSGKKYYSSWSRLKAVKITK